MVKKQMLTTKKDSELSVAYKNAADFHIYTMFISFYIIEILRMYVGLM